MIFAEDSSTAVIAQSRAATVGLNITQREAKLIAVNAEVQQTEGTNRLIEFVVGSAPLLYELSLYIICI
jgi:hypothetical protein